MATYQVPAVYNDDPRSIERLAQKLKTTYQGSIKLGEVRAFAKVIAMTYRGEFGGPWGSLAWTHNMAGYESHDVEFEWGP